MGTPFEEIYYDWPAAKIALYQCYFRVAPWGPVRDDIRTAQQTSFIASATGVEKKGGGTFSLDDFLLFTGKPQVDESSEPEGNRMLKDMFKSGQN